MDRETKESRLGFIRQVMDQQGMKGNPRRVVVLHAWNRITEWSREFELSLADQNPDLGTMLWAMIAPDSPALEVVELLEKRPEGWWVRLANESEMLVDPGDIRYTPIPYYPLAVKRRLLAEFLGPELHAMIERIRSNAPTQ